MTLQFLMLVFAAVIFRYLASQAGKVFQSRLRGLLPRNVVHSHLKILLQEFPDQFAPFRAQALPYSGLHLILNTAACAIFSAALWYFPPAVISAWNIAFLQYASLVVVPIAFAVDFSVFCKLFFGTSGRKQAPSGTAD